MKKMRFLLFILPLFIFSCNGIDTDLTVHVNVNPDCNIFSQFDCLSPFPTNQFFDSESKKIDIPVAVMSKTTDKFPFPATEFEIFNGFSPATQIIYYSPTTINFNKLPDINHTENSVQEDSVVQLINTETKERVPVFTEPDSRSFVHNVLLIHPLRRLKPSSTYIVVLTKDVTNGSSPLPFKVLRDNITTDSGYLNLIKSKYEKYFSLTEKLNIKRENIYLMWDFTTGSDENIIKNNMLKIRDFLDEYDFANDTITITKDELYPQDDTAGIIYREITGDFSVPWFLDNSGRILRKNGVINVEKSSVKRIPFMVNIPKCVTNTTAKVMIFGHGLGGSYESAKYVYFKYMAENVCSVIISINIYGSDTDGILNVVGGLADSSRHSLYAMIGMAENLMQGHSNLLSLGKIIKTKNFWESLNEQYYANIDTEDVFYFGASNGGIEGGTFAGLTQEVSKFALNVPGAVWSVLFQRNDSWNIYETLLLSKIPNKLEISEYVVLLQMFFDFIDPITYAPYVLQNRNYLNLPEKQILYQESIGDPSVSNVATRIWVRTSGIIGLSKLVQSVYGVTEKEGPLDSAYVQWDLKAEPLPPDGNSPINAKQSTILGGGVYAHALINFRPVRTQIERFIRDSKIYQVCSDSVCDPD